MRAVLRRLIDAQPDLEPIGGAPSAEAALERLDALEPDLLLVDLALPGTSGDGLVAHLRPRRPGLQASIVSGHDGEL